MYKCLECGHLFEEGEQKTNYNSLEFWGATVTETESVCPICGGVYEEAKFCPICKRHYIVSGDTEYGEDFVCDECFNENIDMSVIAKWYESNSEMNILCDELASFGGRIYEDIVSRVCDGKPVSDKALKALAVCWKDNTMNLYDFREWLGGKDK